MARGEIPNDLDPEFVMELAESPFLAAVMFHTLDAPSEAKSQRMIGFIVAGLTGIQPESGSEAPSPS